MVGVAVNNTLGTGAGVLGAVDGDGSGDSCGGDTLGSDGALVVVAKTSASC